jgi:hypothetical protein
MDLNRFGQLGDGGTNFASIVPELILPGSALADGHNTIADQPLSRGAARLPFLGLAGTNYPLDRTFKLSPANWLPQVTNLASAGGVLVLKNTPKMETNNFWRICSVP